MNFLSVYDPTLRPDAEAKDEFYGKLGSTIKAIPASKELYFLNDFNTRIEADHVSWPGCTGHFGVRKINENRQTL